VFCSISAEDYDDYSDISIERMLSNGAIFNDDAEGQGRHQGEGRVLIERPIRTRLFRRRNVPLYSQQLTKFDYNSPSA